MNRLWSLLLSVAKHVLGSQELLHTSVMQVLFLKISCCMPCAEQWKATEVCNRPTGSGLIGFVSVCQSVRTSAGGSIESIAEAKAGIMKARRPVVIAKQPYPEALRVLEHQAKQLECPVLRPHDLIQLTVKGTVQEEGRLVQMVAAAPHGLSWLQPTGMCRLCHSTVLGSYSARAHLMFICDLSKVNAVTFSKRVHLRYVLRLSRQALLL